MSGINRLLYTLAKYDPRDVEDGEQQVVDVLEHNGLMARLSGSGINKFNIVILSTIRYVVSYITASMKQRLKMDVLTKETFKDDRFDLINDDDKLYIVERIYVDSGEIYFTPINAWNIDVRIMKSVLIRKMFVVEMGYDDIDAIISAFNMEEYWSSVKIGGVENADRITFVQGYNHYLYEFYKRSDSPEEERLSHYKEQSDPNAARHVYDKRDVAENIKYDLTLYNSIEQTNCNIDEYCANLKYYAKRMYEINYSEDYYKVKSGGGNSEYTVQFRLWKRCIDVFDLFKEYEAVGKCIKIVDMGTVDRSRVDAICRKIAEKYELSKKDIKETRKTVIQDYIKAQKLIALSCQGHLSLP